MDFANYDYQKYVDDRNYNYQVSRDKVADSQWQKEYELSKKKSNSSGSSSRRSSSAKSSSSKSNTGKYSLSKSSEKSVQDILKGVKTVSGPNINKNIYDSTSGKYFSNMDELLAYHGYASIN